MTFKNAIYAKKIAVQDYYKTSFFKAATSFTEALLLN